jgi:hypothetical protein
VLREKKEKTMQQIVGKLPSKKTNRIFLIIGILIFFPLYFVNIQQTNKIITMELLFKMYTSFDLNEFVNIISLIKSQQHENSFSLVYFITIIAMIGFLLFSFSLSVIIIRMNINKKLPFSIGMFFLFITILITIIDIATSIIMIIILKNIISINIIVVYVIDAAYILRVIFLYLLILWFVYNLCITITKKMFRHKNVMS